jgi:lipid II:glycine glycyltransferase (peptidoglycan interpeptide bridge formation enzyme)
VHSPRFIDEILRSFGGRTDILTVKYQGRPIAAMMLIKFHDAWIDPLAASLAEFKAKNANMLLYWEALRAACEAGAKEFDFGRSYRGSGTYNFKKQWGAKEAGLIYYTYHDGRVVQAAATNFYRSKAASTLAKIWQVLPEPAQRRLGPTIRRWLP